MNVARTRAARLRGVFVGASAGAVAVAGHGVAGAALPASSSIVLMVLLCAAVGAIASSSAQIHRRPLVVLAYVSAGQLIGHCTLDAVCAAAACPRPVEHMARRTAPASAAR